MRADKFIGHFVELPGTHTGFDFRFKVAKRGTQDFPLKGAAYQYLLWILGEP